MLKQRMLVRRFERTVRQKRVGDSLLFLNRILAVSRAELNDKAWQNAINRLPHGAPPFVVHLLAKHILTQGRDNPPFALDWQTFPEAFHLAFQLAISDPLNDSTDESVHGAMIR